MIPHLPGLTPRPSAPIRPGLGEGLALYRRGFYWEAHEAWEPVWLAQPPNSRERAYLQGLIQLANARLKLAMARPAAARRIAALVAGHLDRAGDGPVLGEDPASARHDLAALLQAIPAPSQEAGNCIKMHKSGDSLGRQPAKPLK